MHIKAIPDLGTTTTYLLIDTPTKHVAHRSSRARRGVAVRATHMSKSDYDLKAIVSTHHHYDHAGGEPRLPPASTVIARARSAARHVRRCTGR